MNSTLIDYPALAHLATRVFEFGPERAEAGRVLAELQAERALADDLAEVLYRYLTEEDDVIVPEVERMLARYREVRGQ